MLKSVGEPLFQADIKGLVPVLNGFPREDEIINDYKKYENDTQALYDQVAEHRCDNYCYNQSYYTLNGEGLI